MINHKYRKPKFFQRPLYLTYLFKLFIGFLSFISKKTIENHRKPVKNENSLEKIV
jgi:hypothetical protein